LSNGTFPDAGRQGWSLSGDGRGESFLAGITTSSYFLMTQTASGANGGAKKIFMA